MRLLAFAAGLVLGAWAGFRLWPRTVAEPARLFSYTAPKDWKTVTIREIPSSFTVGPTHPLQ